MGAGSTEQDVPELALVLKKLMGFWPVRNHSGEPFSPSTRSENRKDWPFHCTSMCPKCMLCAINNETTTVLSSVLWWSLSKRFFRFSSPKCLVVAMPVVRRFESLRRHPFAEDPGIDCANEEAIKLILPFSRTGLIRRCLGNSPR